MVSHQCGVSSVKSLISHDLSSVWSVTRVVCQCGLLSVWSVIGIVSNHNGLSSVWSVIRVVSHQGGLSSV